MEEWEAMYAHGYMGFEETPAPDQACGEIKRSPSGIVPAPRPSDEHARQRAVNHLRLMSPTRQTRISSTDSSASTSSGEESISSTTTASETSTAASSVVSLPDLEAESEEVARKAVPRSRSPAPPLVQEGLSRLHRLEPTDGATNKSVASLFSPRLSSDLRRIVKSACEFFATPIGAINLIDDSNLIILAEDGLDGLRAFPRSHSICGHTLLASSNGQGDFVVLDTLKDWRFSHLPACRFYAGCTVRVPLSPIDDESGAVDYAVGTLCLLDSQPRPMFSSRDRAKLAEFAQRTAGLIMAEYDRECKARAQRVARQREEWRRRKRSFQGSLAVVAEVATPPPSPPLGLSEIPESPPRQVSSSFTVKRLHRRHGSSGSLVVVATPVAPAFQTLSSSIGVPSGRRRASVASLSAALDVPGCVRMHINRNLDTKLANLLNLSTQLAAESLELSCAYLAAVPLDAPMETTLLSGKDIPKPPPFINVELHMEFLQTEDSVLLYVNPDIVDCSASGDFQTGLVARVGVLNGVGYLLGALSDDPARVFTQDDVSFLQSFAHELRRSLPFQRYSEGASA